jgi:hypothetical protein
MQFSTIKFRGGRPLLGEISAGRLNEILAEIKRNRPVAGPGVDVSYSGQGTKISVKPGGKKIVNPARLLPWDIYIKKVEGDGEEVPYVWTLGVQPGTITFILPSNWDSEFTAQEGDLLYGIANITTDGNAITSLSISMQDEYPEPQTYEKFAVAEEIKVPFGLFIDGSSFNLFGASQFFYPRLRLVTSADPAAEPGQSPFDLWYELAP